MTNEEKQAMKEAYDARVHGEIEDGYTVVLVPIPPGNQCHACGDVLGNGTEFGIGGLFERDTLSMHSYATIAILCKPCGDDPDRTQKLRDWLVSYGKQTHGH